MTIFEKEHEIIQTILKRKKIENAYLMYWGSQTYLPNDENNIPINELRLCKIKPNGCTYLKKALKDIPEKWISQNKKTIDIYIVTDGEIHDSNKELLPLLKKYIAMECNIFIITVESNYKDYNLQDCNAGNDLYKIIQDGKLSQYVRKFTCFNNRHKAGFVNLNNPILPTGFIPFRNLCFKITDFSLFIKYLDNEIEKNKQRCIVKISS